MVKTKSEMKFRWAVRRDLSQMVDIERAAFRHPWTEDDFVKMLRQRTAIAMVAEVHGQIVGFMVYELGKNKIYLHNIAVATKGIGIGRGLNETLKKKLLLSSRRKILECHVRETNLDACLFFKAMGWRALRIVPQFYEDENLGDEDAYLFQWRAKRE